ncbi:MAG: CCA tRNA nucleotidyltransferase [Algisphaera sp.]
MSRAAAIQTIRTLRQHGHVALLAGGCVRDRLRGTTPKDHDIATDATPQRVRELFKRTRSVGEALGVMIVEQKTNGERASLEVATFRTDGDYNDGRRPSTVTFTDAKHDAQRRDFTINGLFEDPLHPEAPNPQADADGVIDYVGGRVDLTAGIVRAIGDPNARFGEDYLRMLRAVRFAARLNFTLEPATQAAIAQHAPKLADIARERIGDELRLTLTGPKPSHAAALLDALGLTNAALNTTATQCGSQRLKQLDPRATFATRLYTWLTERQPSVSPTQARKALALSNEETTALRQLRRFNDLLAQWPDLTTAQRKRRLAEPDWHQACLAWNAGCAPHDLSQTIQSQATHLANDGIGLAPEPWVTGEDLIAAGLQPGPNFKQHLDTAYDAQLEGQAMNKDQALVIALPQ